MKRKTTRRDFLKLAGTVPFGLAATETMRKLGVPDQVSTTGQNFLIIVFDALSAFHISTYGYQRETTPNLARLSQQAVVYHHHYASGNFTTPGTASLLTGALPWTHRALQPKGTLANSFVAQNIFGAVKGHYGIAYTHNPWAYILLEQISSEIVELIPRLSLFIESYDEIIHKVFSKDEDTASVSWLRNTDVREDGFAYSLFLSHLYEALREKNIADLREEYPRGIPSIGRVEAHYLLDQAINWIAERLRRIPQPFLGYFHFLPPHGPYRPPLEFIDRFANDGYKPLEKPNDVFTDNWTYEDLRKKRIEYDEFILHVDDQFNIFFEELRNSGLLENTWLIFTSDHGEMFERGIDGHSTKAMYQPVLRVPLMIFEPGRTKRKNIFAPTSAIDILPTILKITNQEIPDWVEGKVLPPYSDQSPNPDRNVYAIWAGETEKNAPITQSSTILVRGRYKLHYYRGYATRGLPDEFIRLFDIESDPEELVDLSESHKRVASQLLDELKTQLDEVNKPYQ